MTKQKAELEMWHNIKIDMNYPENDNNDGFVYGLNLLCEDANDIIEVHWFKSDKKRFEFINQYNLDIINE
tara:strand:- start:542 stop:751 length:210 start_codon:yes stop_codon:yes gene_type:complete